MKLESRVDQYLKSKEGDVPWSYGFDPEAEGASGRAVAVWLVLTPGEKLIVSRFNPFKMERVKKIKELNKQGLPQTVLCELSGLSMNTITRIVLKKKCPAGKKKSG